jgi:hypothetical protein
MIRLEVQIEVIGNADAGRDLEARAAIGEVADSAGEHRESSIQDDPAGLQRPATGVLSLLQH